MAKVELVNIFKRYETAADFTIKGVDLEIRDQEFMIFLGPSGCGKTTTLRMIAGLEEISSGQILIDSKVVNDLPPKDRDIAMVFQNYALYPHMNVFDNMAFGLKLRKMPRHDIEQKVKEAAQVLGIEDLLSRKPKQLSGGQRQRVALGRAIVRNPKVFLMDEPLSNLDAKLRVQMRSELSKLHKKLKTTFIYVTHDQVEAMTMGDRIAIFNGGIVQQIGTPYEVYHQPANRFVAGFIGSPPMNFIPATLSDDARTLIHPEFKLGLTKKFGPALTGYKGRNVLLGARPEDFEMTDKVEDGRTFQARVDLVEPLGPEDHVYMALQTGNFVIRVSPDKKMTEGTRIIIRPVQQKVHLFDPETGAAIL
ncbi:MAG: sn-glycerol-3-phosphate ABC transporter ATP-binding protein UgpC [Candidatus Wallbacteria bacterium]|nr:sn-glycerol-3-phosphate ABC transporter ATP-binding protein UgpC [Candidatus Wallbacteria bacterium]